MKNVYNDAFKGSEVEIKFAVFLLTPKRYPPCFFSQWSNYDQYIIFSTYLTDTDLNLLIWDKFSALHNFNTNAYYTIS